MKFIILTRGRTGSNMLKTALGKHKDISCSGEAFRSLKELGFLIDDRINQIFVKPKKKVKGCKIFYWHSRKEPYSKIWNYLRDERIKIIHLHRKNYLRTYVSNQIASNHQYVVKKEKDLQKTEDKIIKIDVEDFKKYKNKNQRRKRLANKWFKDNEMIHVYYKDLCNNWEKELRKIFNFLEVEYENVKPDTLKQNPEPLKILIKNYEDVRKIK